MKMNISAMSLFWEKILNSNRVFHYAAEGGADINPKRIFLE
jgi:hypothetical protein